MSEATVLCENDFVLVQHHIILYESEQSKSIHIQKLSDENMIEILQKDSYQK